MLGSHISRTNVSIGTRLGDFDIDRIGDFSFERGRCLQRNVDYANVTKCITEDIRATQGSLAVTSQGFFVHFI